jgi:hypothetical protein
MTAEDDLDPDLATVRVRQSNWRAPAVWAAAPRRQLWPPARGSDIQGVWRVVPGKYPDATIARGPVAQLDRAAVS